MEISAKIERVDARPDPVTEEVILEIVLRARIKPEDALIFARKIELAASEALGTAG